MKVDNRTVWSGRGRFQFDGEFHCVWCKRHQKRRSSQQRFCNAKCRDAYYDSIGGRHPTLRGEDGLAAPELKASCDVLEAQCRARHPLAWLGIIAQFTTPDVPGYRNLTRTTRWCVAAKLKLGVENG